VIEVLLWIGLGLCLVAWPLGLYWFFTS